MIRNLLRCGGFFLWAMLGLLAVSSGATAQQPPVDFPTWVGQFQQRALKAGISPAILQAAFANATPDPRVVELDKKQPENTITLTQYLKNTLSKKRIEQGRALLRQYAAELDAVSKTYGVPAPYIVALWGMETDFGRNTGGYNVISSLTTLAYEGRRAAFFEKELLEALYIADQGGIPLDQMKGSWAGAMGQCQFMPSTYLTYAIDFNRDGRADIWNTPIDVFASAAHYLSRLGWKANQSWGRAVRLPTPFDQRLIGLDNVRPLSEWQKLGVKRADGTPLPTADLNAALISPNGFEGQAFLVYDNFRVIRTWNKSNYFATAVGLLADELSQ